MIITELQYFPPITSCISLCKETYVFLDIYESYRKMSFRNRCLIAGAQGIISLSVPLTFGRNQHRAMNEVRISNAEDWQKRHFKSIRSAYNRSPFFEYYQNELEELYQQPVALLTEWNLTCLKWLEKKLDFKSEIRLTDMAAPYGAPGWEDHRNRFLPKSYNQWDPIQYRQVFEERTGFFPNLSILDLLFNTGRDAGKLLRNAALDK